MSDSHSGPPEQAPGARIDRAAAKLLDDIFATRPDEIQCDQAALDIVQCADRKLSDADARRRYPALFHHFRFCPDCAGEYDIVMDFVRQEAAGLVPRPTVIPPPPAYLPEPAAASSPARKPPKPAESDLLAAVKGVIRQALDALTPMQPVLVRRMEPGAQPVNLPMEGGEVFLTLTLAQEQTDPQSRRLVCTVETTNPALEESLAAAILQLLRTDNDELFQEQPLNRAGDATFARVPPGTYTVAWSLGAESFAASGIELG